MNRANSLLRHRFTARLCCVAGLAVLAIGPSSISSRVTAAPISATSVDEPVAAPTDATPTMAITSQSFFLIGNSELHVSLEVDDTIAQQLITESPSPEPVAPTPSSTSDVTAAPDGSADPAAPTTTSPPPPPPPPPTTLTIRSFPAIAEPTSVDRAQAGSPLGEVAIQLSPTTVEAVTVTDEEAEDESTVDTGRSRITIAIGRRSSSAPVNGSIEALDIDAPGLYPLTFTLTNEDTTLATTSSHVFRSAPRVTAEDQIKAALLVPITDIGPAPSKEAIDAARSELEQLVEIAENTELALTVRIPLSVVGRILDNDTVLDTQVRNAVSDHQLIGSPTWPIDPDPAITAGVEQHFISSWTTGVRSLEARYPNASFDALTTLLDQPTSASGIGLTGRAGKRFVLLSPALLDSATFVTQDPLNPARASGQLVSLSAIPQDLGQSAMATTEVTLQPRKTSADVANAGVNESTDNLTSSDTEQLTPTEAAIKTLAYLTARPITEGTSGATVVFSGPDLTIPDPDLVAALEQVATPVGVDNSDLAPMDWQFASLVLASTQSADARPSTTTAEWSVEPTDPLANRVTAFGDTVHLVNDTMSMLAADDPRRSNWLIRTQAALSSTIDDEQATELLDLVVVDVNELRAGVPPPEPFEFTLTGANATLRIQLTNNTDTWLHAVFVLRSERLIGPERTAVHLAPNAVTVVPVQVSSRSNGRARAQVHLETPAGGQLFEPVVLTGTANSVGGLGTALTAGAVLVLISWWFSHMSRRRNRIDSQSE